MLLLVGCRPAAVEDESICGRFCVGERFTTFYENHNGRILFGEPRSGEIVIEADTAEERLVQFFDNVRLDLNPAAGEVEMAPLGKWAYEGRADRPLTGEPNDYEIEGAFKAFFEANEGMRLFGPPLSPLMEEGGLKVQYFQNVRLEWQPGASSGRQVALSPLGRAQYLKEYFEPPLIAQPIDVDQQQVDRLLVEADVSAPVLYAGDEQNITISILSADRQPVRNAAVSMTVKWADEERIISLESRTDANGQAQTRLDGLYWEPGEEVTIEIYAFRLSNNPLGKATIAFETWW